MKTTCFAIPLLLLLALAPCTLCQANAKAKDSNHEAYGEKCPALHSADPATLLQYLNENKPTPRNAICVTWAIYGVGDAKYDPAIPALVGLLDFKPPVLPGLKTWDHLPGSAYPAVEALEDIGRPALPALLAAMKDTKTSAVAQSSAVEAWTEIYGHTLGGSTANAFAALRREINTTSDAKIKTQLEANIQDGLRRWCSEITSEHAACVQSAQDGVDR
ncbi:MAG TPA: hypothetical protein VN661_08190 [Candidatus Acidoferrales bacterium]|nr:hypothetical protein [Candidatus Acidoferrales bacterium]